MEVLGIRSHLGIWREVTWISDGDLNMVGYFSGLRRQISIISFSSIPKCQYVEGKLFVVNEFAAV